MAQGKGKGKTFVPERRRACVCTRRLAPRLSRITPLKTRATRLGTADDVDFACVPRAEASLGGRPGRDAGRETETRLAPRVARLAYRARADSAARARRLRRVPTGQEKTTPLRRAFSFRDPRPNPHDTRRRRRRRQPPRKGALGRQPPPSAGGRERDSGGRAPPRDRPPAATVVRLPESHHARAGPAATASAAAVTAKKTTHLLLLHPFAAFRPVGTRRRRPDSAAQRVRPDLSAAASTARRRKREERS